MSDIIVVDHLSRSFVTEKPRPDLSIWKRWFSPPLRTTLTAVDDLCFSIGAGEKVAFIGPNGAGKSTTLKMLSGLLFPTSGTASVCGLVPWEKTRRLSSEIGLVFGQKSQLWPALTIYDSFDLLAKIYDLDYDLYRKQADRLIDLFRIHKIMDQSARTLSLGQRMRCDIAAALLHQPKVLFLDEPTIGLDVTAKALLRDHLNLLARELETTILLTSHDTDDIEQICRRVILIDHGKKLIDTGLQELKQDFARYKQLRLVTEEETPSFAHEGVNTLTSGDFQLCLSIDSQKVQVDQIVMECLQRFKIQDISIESASLEEVIKSLYAAQRGKT